MSIYIKPEAYLTEFSPDTAIAAACDSQWDHSEKYPPEQTINCIINGNEKVFFSASPAKCQVDVGGAGTLYTYNGKLYFLWYNPIFNS